MKTLREQINLWIGSTKIAKSMGYDADIEGITNKIMEAIDSTVQEAIGPNEHQFDEHHDEITKGQNLEKFYIRDRWEKLKGSK